MKIRKQSKWIVLFVAFSMILNGLCGCGKRESAVESSQDGSELSVETSQSSNDSTTSSSDVVDQKDGIVLPDIQTPNTVVILAMGGTIAGTGEDGKSSGYTAGVLKVEDLIKSVPGIDQIANLEAVQICNLDSNNVTSELWIVVANTINELAKNKNVTGFVVTHGTDTLEETAFFLNLTVKTDKPVVVTGAMRPATSLSADGPMNLYQSVVVAASKESVGKGVMVVFSDCIISARSIRKASTYSETPMITGEDGILGNVFDESVEFYNEPRGKHTTNTQFDVSHAEKLPVVTVIFSNVDASPEVLQAAAEYSEGIVIAGSGAGGYSLAFEEVIRNLDIPVVISSRTMSGPVGYGYSSADNIIMAGDMTPQKAAVLLRVALLDKNVSKEQIAKMYEEY